MGSGTPVLRDFAKIVTFGPIGFEWGMGPPPPFESHFWDGFGRNVYPARAGMGSGWRVDLGRKSEGYEVNT